MKAMRIEGPGRPLSARALELPEPGPGQVQVNTYPLERANAALDDLRAGRFSGAAVLVP